MLESEEGSAQDTVGMRNGEPFRSQEVNAVRSEDVGDEEIDSMLGSHESGVAKCECDPSIKCGETIVMRWQIVFQE